MERKAIGIQGISTGSNYDDGACVEMVNMRHEQGVLKPVESLPVDFTLKHVYELLYWHKNNDYAHLIGVRNNGIYWIQHPGEVAEDEGVALLTVTGSVTLSNMGNILNVLDGDVLKYLFWKDNSYFIVDFNFDGNQTDTVLGPVKIELKVDADYVTYTSNNKLLVYRETTGEYINYSDSSDFNKTSNLEIRKNEFKGLISKNVSLLYKDGYPVWFFMACYAIELYDGSYIMCSKPELMGQSNDVMTRYENFLINTNTCDYVNNVATFRVEGTGIASTSDYTDYRTKDIELPRNTDAIKSGSYVDCTVYPSTLGYVTYGNPSTGTTRSVKAIVYRNKFKFKISEDIKEELRPLIKSVSIFITSEVSPFDNESILSRQETYNPLGGVNTLVENYTFKNKTSKEIIEELSTNQKFYKVHEIAFDDIKTTTENDGWVTIDLKGKLGDNLLGQPELNTAFFSNIKTKNQMTYNSMLHAWDIKNVIGRGWPFSYFTLNNGLGQFQSENIDVTGILWYIEVLIKTDNSVTKVVRYSTVQSPFIDLSPIISYPDSRATQITIYQYGEKPGIPPFYFKVMVATKKIFKLTSSSTNNFAYYISPDLKPISFTPSAVVSIEEVPVESNQQLSYQNKLKVSNTNNPFVFPDGQTYQIGDGTILNVASQSIRTSDGQFGQYPLVCFCTDGVFTLQVGDGTVAYSKVGTPQNYERPISKVICVTPYGIAFISNRGLCMVVGQDIEYLSEPMFEKFRILTLELPAQIEGLFALDLGTFNDYLKACTAMVYNPKEQEIVMINPDKAYNYVYNMITKQFYRNTEAITNEINNSLPDMQVWNGTTVKKVTVVEAGTRAIKFVTRPIKMQTPDMKRFERVVLRAYLSAIAGTPATACIWGSVDDRNFKLLRGMVLQNGTARKDIDFGLFGKTTYRSYVIGLSMTVGTDSEIEAIEMQVEQEFVDTRMR